MIKIKNSKLLYIILSIILIFILIVFLSSFYFDKNNKIITVSDIPTTIKQFAEKESRVSEFSFEVPEINEGRLQIQLRIPLDDVKISLIAPSGIVVVDSDDSRIIFQSRSTLHNPERGDQFLLPEQKNPQAGSWKLHLTHKPASGDEVISVTLSLLERFLLNLIGSENTIYAGQPVILTVLATDYGQPVRGLTPKIQVLHDGKQLETHLTTSSSATAPSGINLTNEQDTYLATYTPTFPGSYQFITHVTFSGHQDKVIKDASITLEVGPKQASLNRLTTIPVQGSDGCLKAIDFLLSITVKESGMYTLSLFFEGLDGQDLEFSATKNTEDGIINFRIPLLVKDARQKLNSQLIAEIKAIDLLRIDDQGFTLIGRYGARDIEPPILLNKPCR